jgi:hypothetical protein
VSSDRIRRAKDMEREEKRGKDLSELGGSQVFFRVKTENRE